MAKWAQGLKAAFAFAAMVALLGAAVVFFMPNYYRSEARILPVDAKSTSGGLGNFASAAAALGVAIPGNDSSDINFVDILQSRTIAERLLATEYKFSQRSWRFGANALRIETMVHYLGEKNMDRSVNEFGRIFSVTRDPKTKIIFVDAETKSPELSKQIVENAIKLLENFLQQKGRTRGGAKALFAEARLGEARKEMAEAEDKFRLFMTLNRNYQISADPGVKLLGMRLEMELKLRQQMVTTLTMSREQALLDEKNDIPILNVMDQANLPIDKSRPVRMPVVAALFFFSFLGHLAWTYREWLRANIFATHAEDPS